MGYLLAKEGNFGLGTSSKHKNVTEICKEVNKSPRPYSSLITCSKACLMSQSIIDDSSISTTSSDTMETQSDFEDMPVLVTSTTNLEEQLQELQRKLIEKKCQNSSLGSPSSVSS